MDTSDSSDNLVLLAPKGEAQDAMEAIIAAGRLDRRRKVLLRGGMVEIPVSGCLPGCIRQQDPEFYRKTPTLEEILGDLLSGEEVELLPRGWAILGHTITVKIHPGLEGKRHLIGKALLDIYPRCRCVLWDKGIIGELREPCREVIAGSGSETVHRENGVIFKLDPMRVMFSPGNMAERRRMGLLGKGERVVDMFAGIGYFSLPMAVHSRPERICAIELNPVAFGYLEENIRLNEVEGIIVPVLGDCARLAPVAEADRVVMGLVGSTNRYLRQGIEALRPGGMLHYHQTVPSWLYPQALVDEVEGAASCLGRTAEVRGLVKVKKYAPGVVHGVVDAMIH
ncbi:MAG: class I SAM-dependent methyltransferase family protein [Methanotrichaceae archaeon]|nr:class I SAM-dependent methyltransferase family protein [Methanotrichaceae archaeon]